MSVRITSASSRAVWRLIVRISSERSVPILLEKIVSEQNFDIKRLKKDDKLTLRQKEGFLSANPLGTNKHGQFYYGARCKIAFAECVPDDIQNKWIRATSASIIHSLKNFNVNNKKMECVYAETLTIKELKDFISKNSDADILHISCHGYYDRNKNKAGLMVGQEFWMGDDNDYRVPPVVILSACHVSPRGSGVEKVREALGILSETETKIVYGLFFEGKTGKSIANDLNVSEMAISKRKRTILKKLRKHLEKEKFFNFYGLELL